MFLNFIDYSFHLYTTVSHTVYILPLFFFIENNTNLIVFISLIYIYKLNIFFYHDCRN